MSKNGMLDRQSETSDDGDEVNDIEQAPKKEQVNDICEFGIDLTKAAAEGKLDPVVGRDREISRLIEILGRRKKNNPMLIGEPGVGKSAIVEGIALRLQKALYQVFWRRSGSFHWISRPWWQEPNTAAIRAACEVHHQGGKQ